MTEYRIAKGGITAGAGPNLVLTPKVRVTIAQTGMTGAQHIGHATDAAEFLARFSRSWIEAE
jgi:hypothetical protein